MTTRNRGHEGIEGGERKQDLPPEAHQLVVAQARERGADPDEEEDERAHLREHDEGVQPSGLVPERDVPAAEEDRHRDSGDHEDVQVLAKKYEAKRPPPNSVL
jgi:hypothetical protein